MFITTLFSNPSLYIMLLAMVIFSICLHELMHAYVAWRQGDDTAVSNGHLTMNPMIQMGPLSLLLCAVIGIAWGAVPVNPHRMHHRWSHALVAFAGPATNFVLFIVFSILLGLLRRNEGVDMLWIHFFFMGATLNIVLVVLNMLPVPPFDGHTVFSYFFPTLNQLNDEVRNGAMFIIVIGFFMASPVIFRHASIVVFEISELVAFLTKFLW